MENMKRTTTCGALKAANAGEIVILNGWVHQNRDLGGVHFINLRDRYGVTQVVIDADAPAELAGVASELKYEYVIAVEGTVRKRPDSMINAKMATGEIEVVASKIEILNSCEVLPFMVEDGETGASENARLKYRYIDMRSGGMQERMKLRHNVTFALREYLAGQEFYEIETPTLIKSTPEGARDFLVPSRIHNGKFFALPQSPQLFKQLLMVSGFDRYFQVARCYRDEDPRGDRQLEFTQVDLEMTFVGKEEVYKIVEGMMAHAVKKAKGITLETPFPRISYYDAMNLYGSDKPEQRFDMKLIDFSAIAEKSDFAVFKGTLDEGGVIKALVVKGVAADYSRKKITELEEVAKIYGAKGLAWMKVTENGLDGGCSKFFTEMTDEVLSVLGAKEGDLLLFMADKWQRACTALGAVRSRLGIDLGLIEPDTYHFSWVEDFPLFEYNEEEGKWDPAHHMFSMPKEEFLETLESNPGPVIGELYDLVCNGYELGSGSIRIHNPELQQRIFNVVGFDPEEAQRRFGFLLDAFKYGAPPHGGFAAGLDRLVMILAGQTSIKEVIAFPKNNMAASPMDESPAFVDEGQMQELGLAIVSQPEAETQDN